MDLIKILHLGESFQCEHFFFFSFVQVRTHKARYSRKRSMGNNSFTAVLGVEWKADHCGSRDADLPPNMRSE